MKLVMGLCDRVLGARLWQEDRRRAAAAVQKDPRVIAAYLGGEVTLNLKGT